MEKPLWLWSSLLLLILVHFVRCAPYNCKNVPVYPRDTGQYCEETLNSMTFSLGPRAGIEDDSTLNGTIKRLSGWKEYNRTLGTLARCPHTNCDPSQLWSLKLVQKSRNINQGIHESSYDWPVIQFEFTVPKPSFVNNYVVGAIKLTFSSDKNSIKGDPSFKQKHRLFDFTTYRYSSPDSDDARPELQRLMQFPCFMGFFYEGCPTEDYKVYSLTLTSFSNKRTEAMLKPYTELTYNITIYGYYAYHPGPNVWKSTIAIALFPGNKDVTVVFDQAPDSRSVSMYNVSLIVANTNITYKYELVSKEQNRWCFENTEDGVYYILIRLLCDGSACIKNDDHTKSHWFFVGKPKPFHIEGAVGQSNGMSSTLRMFLSVGSGVCLALTLLGLLCYYRWKKQIPHDIKKEMSSFPKILLIYNVNETYLDLAQNFARICRENMQITIINDFQEDETRANEQTGYPFWYRERSDELSAAIVLWTPGSNIKPGPRDNEFNIAINTVLQLKIQNDLKLACVYFQKSHKRTIPKELQKHSFLIPEHTLQMKSFLIGHKRHKDVNSSIQNQLLALKNKYFKIKHVEKTLQIDIEDADDEEETIPLRCIDDEMTCEENIILNPRCPIHCDQFVKETTYLPQNRNRCIHGKLLKVNHTIETTNTALQDDMIEDFAENQERTVLNDGDEEKLGPDISNINKGTRLFEEKFILNPRCPVHGLKNANKKSHFLADVMYCCKARQVDMKDNGPASEISDKMFSDDLEDVDIQQETSPSEPEGLPMKRHMFSPDRIDNASKRWTPNAKKIIVNPMCPIHGDELVDIPKPLSTCNEINNCKNEENEQRSPVQTCSFHHPHDKYNRTKFPDAEEYRQQRCRDWSCIHSQFHNECEHIQQNRFVSTHPQRIISPFENIDDEIDFSVRRKKLPSKHVDCCDKSMTYLSSEIVNNTDDKSLKLQASAMLLEGENTLDRNRKDKFFRRSRSTDSMKSQNSDCSCYTRRSASISSLELKESFQNFV